MGKLRQIMGKLGQITESEYKNKRALVARSAGVFNLCLHRHCSHVG